MMVLTWAVAWLALFVHDARATANQCGRHGERCSDSELAEPVRNEAALLQAKTGKITATLPEESAGGEAQNATAPTVPQPPAPRPVVEMQDTLVAQPKVAEPGSSEDLTLATVQAASGQDGQEASWLFSGGSVFAAAHRLVHHLRKELPDRVVYVFPSMQTDVGTAFGLAIMSSVIWCSLVTLAACYYRSQKSFPQAISSRSKQDFNDWTSGPFDICSDARVCCWSCWCPCIRWADNMDMLGILGFWVGLLLFCGLIMLTTVPGGLLLWLVAVLLWMSFRQQLRLKFDMEQSTFRTFAGDCALYCCCWPCAIAQEARHIEEACRAAHPAMRKVDDV